MTTTDTEQLLNSCESQEYSNVDVQVNRFRNMNSINGDLTEEELKNPLTTSIRRRTQGFIAPGSLNILSAKYESLDYDTCENYLLHDEEKTKGYKFIVHKNLARWVIFVVIGMVTALIACVVNIAIEELCILKYGLLKSSVDENVIKGQLYIPFLLWVVTNIVPTFIGSMLVTYVEPIASGSGIPIVKCYLNGVKVPRVVRIKTLVVKTVGVVCSVVGGLAGGKEGPMIHTGAVVAAGLSQGKSTTFGRDLKVCQYFREDHEKRDFVSGGAAAGVSAAFGAPVGGVLFSLEEGTSFWNQSLTWKTFLASVVSTFTLNFVLSAYHGHLGQLNYSGLLNLGKFDALNYDVYELPIFVFMGALGGLSGAIWNHINYKLAVFRIRFLKQRWMKVFEACLVAAASATAGFLMLFLLSDCKPLGQDPTDFPVQLYCNDGEYNVLAAIWFQTPEASVRSLFHDPDGSHHAKSLFAFFIVYFLLACWTFGLSVSSGLFIPTLLVGAAWGRLFSSAIHAVFPNLTVMNPGKYALIGAAAQLGGVVRMTISLTVILMETTGNISIALPLIITLIAAKWTGDFFNEGIYDTYIQLAGIPLLPWEPPPLSHTVYASEVMSHPIVTMKTVENVGHIIEVLKITTYNGFPVVDPPLSDQPFITTYGRLRGLILRAQLIVLIKRRLFNETAELWADNEYISSDIFREEYPRYPTIDDINVTEEEKTNSIDLRPFMNPSPYTVLHSTSLPRMFRLFRALGLRHLPIINDVNEVIGMVTRKDLARYRVNYHHGRIALEELLVSKDI